MRIFIKVKVRTKNNKVEKLDDDHFVVSTTKSPEKGKANESIINILASHFNIPRINIKIISGLSSRRKIIEIIN